MTDDAEIEVLKKRKLREMKRRLRLEQLKDLKAAEEEKKATEPKPSPKDVLKTVFAGRAWEVWDTAEAQYPTVTQEIAVALAALIEAGKLKGAITGEQLYAFFRQLGLRVRLKTKIRIYESGELKTIADKLRSE